ncbi:hypothetical protein K431DRAFT_281761 [Polychaeton citri CBS 116435]|uniref:Uncharacterized protein n=1 Tax=Polychaeton citri CBS 116435 TaxID=1314669 RepID=A0A9P4QFR2_9PEZI|nr:hypothetical protein K431DRAFT_281761 [Polychaeton citri CBS 116435]
MSQQFNYPPPPPSPNPGSNATAGYSPSLQRQHPGGPVSPPSLTTNFLRTQGSAGLQQQVHTPVSAVSPAAYAFSPLTPSALHPRTPATFFSPVQGPQANPPPSPSMAAPYNPQQWTQRGHGGSHLAFQRNSPMAQDTREITGMEAAMPSPPPPYSPQNPTPLTGSRSATINDVAGFSTSPLPAGSPGMNAPSANRGQSPSFPPPPGAPSRHRERSASGLANRLANLTGRNRQVSNDIVQNQSAAAQLPMPRPPAARRAASTGHMPPASTASPTPASGRGSPERSWHPGMPLPPPPPGPPPPGVRSQSLNRPLMGGSSRSAASDSSQGTDNTIRVRAQAPSLGAVPPTPANWMEGDSLPQPQQAEVQSPMEIGDDSLRQPLRIETGASNDATTLSRRPARRDQSAQGIRERRSRSRAAKEWRDSTSQPSSEESKPSDLVLGDTMGGSISRRREHMRTTSSADALSPQAQPKHSPGAMAQANRATTDATNSILTPPYTPAVRNQSAEPPQRRAPQPPNSAASDRQISTILQTPNEDTTASTPHSPARATSRPPSSGSAKPAAKLDAFALQALERYRRFVEKEVVAKSDEERLELFATFIVHESRLRRDKYFGAYNSMAADIGDLTRDMWRSYSHTSKRAVTPSTSMSSSDPTMPSWASDGQPASAHGNIPSSATSLDGLTPGTDTASTGDAAEVLERSESRQWDKAFKPSLSPIPSMAQSSAHDDEGSSRGRTQSRWWESETGSIGRPDRMEKSRRETKYMGVSPATFMEAAQPSPANTRNTPTPGASFQSFQSAGYGPDEYPPEKQGWHEDMYDTPIPTPATGRKLLKVPTPGFEPLDVSRLVTLPPPYPRHHPAVNNSHPLLSDLRNEYRTLADLDEIEQIKERYQEEAVVVMSREEERKKERQNQQRAIIQENVVHGKISFADAARAEADFAAEEGERSKANAQSAFETFETVLAHPMNTVLTDRIARANDCIKRLTIDLKSHNEISNPDQAQEEGDEKPERLEKLTLLKWLFEARELLNKEMYDLHSQRSQTYSEVVLAPYRLSKDDAKVDEIAAFFKKDGQERHFKFAQDSLKRFEELQKIMERNVTSGVEDQLSAFWDIAPGLLQVIQQVPGQDMSNFAIFVPPQEYDENPAYHDHPLQYLFTVLSHAEKSAYQFIESQTNLLCLLHEVRTAITKANLRVFELERAAKEPHDRDLKEKMKKARRDEEDRLTMDLQEKVGEVERQWSEALGAGLLDCKGRVRVWLEESGGWDDALDD